jgi:Asp-tRNA(Asn)/Glu-tRNA(Gln) amidotransferase A subunit family amidase
MSSAAARVDDCLARIAALNPQFRAFSTVDAEGARTRAAEIDAASRDGRWLGLLHGMTLAVKDNIATRHATRFTYGGSLAGLPGLSLPCGFTRSGLPIGALLEGAWWREADLLRLGKAWQDRTDWHLRIPPAHADTAARPRVPRSCSRADMRADSRGGKVDAT